MEGIKEAFSRVKDDVDSLKKDVNFLGGNLTETRDQLIDVCEILSKLNNKTNRLEEQNKILNSYIGDLRSDLMDSRKSSSKVAPKTVVYGDSLSVNSPGLANSMHSSVKDALSNVVLDGSLDKQTHSPTERGVLSHHSTNIQTHQSYISPRNPQISVISIGNEGVQTNRQTHKQTDIRRINSSDNQYKTMFSNNLDSQNKIANVIDSAVNMLDSLDSIKKELRLKFKRLTDQELIVFSTIYQLEDEFGYADYKSISKKLSLSESSIRDYARRLVNKGIPIDKNKVNNKEIHLSVSSNLKKIATLNTILELREL